MPAPGRTAETRKQWRSGLLGGMRGVLVASALMLAVVLGWLVLNDDPSRNADMTTRGVNSFVRN